MKLQFDSGIKIAVISSLIVWIIVYLIYKALQSLAKIFNGVTIDSMRKIITTIFVFSYLLIGALAQAQEFKKEKNNSITINPLGMFNVMNPAVQIGYQRNLTKDLILQVEYGIMLKHSVFGFMDLHLYNGSVNYSYSGYKLQTEIKKILCEKGNFFIRKPYIAGEIFYLKNRGNVNNTYVTSTGETYEDFFIQEKHKYRLGAKYGIQLIVTDNFLIDCSAGIGLAWNHVEHFGRNNLEDKSSSPLYGYILKRGDFLRLNFPINLRIGYRF